MKPQYTVSARIMKPVAEVFDAVVDPNKLSSYFTTVGGTSGPLVAGTRVTWWGKIDVDVIEVEENARLVLRWANEQRKVPDPITIEMKFESLDDGATLVSISESGYPASEQGLESSFSTCEGWTQMLCCLKAWVEHGINLREGYFLSELDGKPTLESNIAYLARVRGA